MVVKKVLLEQGTYDFYVSNDPIKEPTQLDRIEAMLIQLTKKKVSKPRAAKSEYSEEFEVAWAEYPKRIGGNPKDKAYAAWNARRNEYLDVEQGMVDMICGATRYAAFCNATVEDKRFIMQAATFYGPSKPFTDDWTIPASVTKAKVPKDNDEMLTWAVKRGMRQPHQGESWNQYRAYVEGEA